MTDAQDGVEVEQEGRPTCGWSAEEEAAHMIKHGLRKPRGMLDEDDIDNLLRNAETLADWVLDDG